MHPIHAYDWYPLPPIQDRPATVRLGRQIVSTRIYGWGEPPYKYPVSDGARAAKRAAGRRQRKARRASR